MRHRLIPEITSQMAMEEGGVGSSDVWFVARLVSQNLDNMPAGRWI